MNSSGGDLPPLGTAKTNGGMNMNDFRKKNKNGRYEKISMNPFPWDIFTYFCMNSACKTRGRYAYYQIGADTYRITFEF